MKYLSRIRNRLVTKNKLQEAVTKYIETINRTLINNPDELNEFKAQVLDRIIELNSEHGRCTPLSPSWHEIGYDNDIYLSGIEFCLFTLHEVKREFKDLEAIDE